MPVVKVVSLVEVPSGSECFISRVRTHDFDKLCYISSLGLVPDTSFHLVSCTPFKGPLRLKLNSNESHPLQAGAGLLG